MRTQVRISSLLGVLALTSLAGCASFAVNTDYDPVAVSRIADFGTYGWLPHPGGGDTRVNNQLVAARVIRAVDNALARKGYQRADSNPDFMLGWHVGLEDKVDVDQINSYYGYGYGRWGRGGAVWGTTETYVDEYTQGTLILDVVDGAANELLWRGIVEGRVHANNSPAEREQRVQEAVDKMLEEFPPGG